MTPREWGSGNDRCALMLHCANAHGGAWRGVATLLADRLHMIAPDGLGHGKAPDWDRQGDYHSAATDYAARFFTPGMDLIGHSFGATVALRLALCQPEAPRSLILIEPVIFAATQGSDTYARSVARFEAYAGIFRAGRIEDAARRFTEEWGNGQRWEDLPTRQRDYIMDRLHLIIAGFPQQYEDVANMLRPGGLEQLTCPILLMRGADSPGSVHAINQELAARTGARELVFEGAAHMLPITHPEPVAAAISGFLNL